MLLKMLCTCDYVLQECNQMIAYIGDMSFTAPMTNETLCIYGEYKVVNIYPRTDGVYGVIFEVEPPHLMMAD